MLFTTKFFCHDYSFNFNCFSIFGWFFYDKNWRVIRSNSSYAGSHLPYELTNIRIKIIKILAGALKAFPRKNIGQFLSRDLIKLPSAVFPTHECAMPPGPLRMSVTRPRGYNPLGVKSSSIQTISLTQNSSAGWLHFLRRRRVCSNSPRMLFQKVSLLYFPLPMTLKPTAKKVMSVQSGSCWASVETRPQFQCWLDSKDANWLGLLFQQRWLLTSPERGGQN